MTGHIEDNTIDQDDTVSSQRNIEKMSSMDEAKYVAHVRR
jgi:hypothetical protein